MTIVLPKTFTPTHDTAGLPGFPAVDVFGKPGEQVRIAVSGKVVRLSGRPCNLGGTPGGAYGQSIYIDAADGQRFLTHFDKVFVRVDDEITPTTLLGTICDSAVSHKPGTSHIHYGFKKAPVPVPPADRLYNVTGPNGGNISKRKTANAIVENVEGWLRTHDDLKIERVK